MSALDRLLELFNRKMTSLREQLVGREERERIDALAVAGLSADGVTPTTPRRRPHFARVEGLLVLVVLIVPGVFPRDEMIMPASWLAGTLLCALFWNLILGLWRDFTSVHLPTVRSAWYEIAVGALFTVLLGYAAGRLVDATEMSKVMTVAMVPAGLTVTATISLLLRRFVPYTPQTRWWLYS
ncbi:major capsid protein [Corynebacterium sp. CCM 9186]|uniref:major capsid protein n=1 Tax=Corynebacterium meridianum TaxID=2765363 RepID=UPI002004276F|nr:major capsid protein [Corynebacterium meridianum]MCK7676959.1 major capsid protein [Corynebacterium meridianum]